MKKFHLIEGEDLFKQEQALQAILAQYPEYEIEKIASDRAFEDYPLMLSEQGLFSKNLVYVVVQPKWLEKTWTKAEEVLAKNIEENLRDVGHRLIVRSKGKLDKRKKAVKWFQKLAEIHSCDPFKDWEQDKILQWLQSYVKNKNIQIDHTALRTLLDYEGNDLKQIVNQMSLLQNMVSEKEVISEAAVKKLLGDKHESIFQLSDVLQKGNFSQVFIKINYLLKQGEDPIRLLGFLAKQLSFFQSILIFSKLSDADLGKKTAKHPFVIKQSKSALRTWLNAALLKNMFFELAEADVNIKLGEVPAVLALKKAVASWKNHKISMQKS